MPFPIARVVVAHSPTPSKVNTAAFLNGEYGVNNLYAGVPVIIGKQGVEKVVEINLSKEEKQHFDNSIKSVKELFDAAKKIDNALS